MSVYEPADSGLPAYFLPMLDDADRNNKYEDAIRRCISEFVSAEGRAPRVLDLGCGTGMLSTFALKHGAAHVVALDINKNMCALARAALEAGGFSKARFTVVCGTLKKGRTRASYEPKERFDVLVSEILGTLATSEGIYEHTECALTYLTLFDGPVCGETSSSASLRSSGDGDRSSGDGDSSSSSSSSGDGGGGDGGSSSTMIADACKEEPGECCSSRERRARPIRSYVVPAAVTVSAAVYEFSSLFGASSAQEPMKRALDALLPLPDANTGEVALMSSQSVAFPLHLLGPRRVSDKAVLRKDTYEPTVVVAAEGGGGGGGGGASNSISPPKACWPPRDLRYSTYSDLPLTWPSPSPSTPSSSAIACTPPRSDDCAVAAEQETVVATPRAVGGAEGKTSAKEPPGPYHENSDGSGGGIELGMVLGPTHFLVLEWTAELWPGVELRNTIDQLSEFGPRNAAARHAQWGFLFCRACDPFRTPAAQRTGQHALSLKAAGWDKGIPKIFVRPSTTGKQQKQQHLKKKQQIEEASPKNNEGTHFQDSLVANGQTLAEPSSEHERGGGGGGTEPTSLTNNKQEVHKGQPTLFDAHLEENIDLRNKTQDLVGAREVESTKTCPSEAEESCCKRPRAL